MKRCTPKTVSISDAAHGAVKETPLNASILSTATGAAATGSMRTIDESWPQPLGEASWTFVEDLKKPLPFVLFWKEGRLPQPGQVDLRIGLTVIQAFPDDKGVLKTAYDDLNKFIAFAKLGGEGTLTITTEKVPTEAQEAYSISVSPKGIRLLSNDTEGIRRAIFHLEELIATADGPFLSPGIIKKNRG